MKAIGKQYNTCKTKQGQIKETIKGPLNFCPRPPHASPADRNHQID